MMMVWNKGRSCALGILMIVLAAFLFSGCATGSGGSMSLEKDTPAPNVGYKTAIHDQLKELPLPAGKIRTAVYSFEDKTGQYKSGGKTTNFSTAVTQGACSILYEALKDSGWFTPLEREGLQHLLKERKIARQAKAQMASSQKSQKQEVTVRDNPPLNYASILLEGGIVGYDTNTVTGGLGVKFFNVGGDTQIRHDQVTVYLRAVDIQSGRVLKSVSVTKSILSHQVNFSVFRFVRPKRLLEAETGYSNNTPRMIATMEAIEKAVFDLIVSGVHEGLWKPEDPKSLEKFREYTEREHVDSILSYEDGELVRKDPEKVDLPDVPEPSQNRDQRWDNTNNY